MELDTERDERDGRDGIACPLRCTLLRSYVVVLRRSSKGTSARKIDCENEVSAGGVGDLVRVSAEIENEARVRSGVQRDSSEVVVQLIFYDSDGLNVEMPVSGSKNEEVRKREYGYSIGEARNLSR